MSVAFLPQGYAQDNCSRVADAARQAGFPEFAVRILAAISGAESGCRPEATYSTPREYSVGPLQLNLMAHPSISEQCARDFLCSAQAAYQISGGGLNFSPWSTYTSGKYLSFLPGVGAAPPATSAPTPSGGQGSPSSTTPAPVVRVLVLVTALVLIVLGFSALRGQPIRKIEVPGT